MLKLSYLAEYVMLAKTLNFSKTAEQMYITQPALSRHITMIEKQIGAKLFLRDTRNVSMTPAGQEVYSAFTEILDKYQLAREKAQMLSSGQSGSLNISSPYYWTAEYTEPIVERFFAKYPLCQIKILPCEPPVGLADVVSGQSDIVLTMQTGTQMDVSLRQFAFTSERMAVVMPAEKFGSTQKSIRLDELVFETLVLLGGGYDIYHPALFSLFERHNIRPRQIIYTQQIETLGLTIRSTGGISIQPYCVRHMNREYLLTIPLEGDDLDIPLCFYYRADNPNPLIPRLIQVSHEVFAEKTKE